MSVEAGFEAIVGQAQAVARLRRTLRHGRVPSAFLFLGPQHIGKTTTALTYAKALNCRETPDDACGACPSCRKIDEGVHPDVELVAPDGQFIRIGQIRALGERLALIPFEARKRVVVLSEAERMNLEAANAFLQTLEEPPHDTLLVVGAERAGALPETSVSRCLRVRFAPLSADDLGTLLARTAGGASTRGAGDDADESTTGGNPPVPAFALRFAGGRLRPELADAAEELAALREELWAALEALGGGAYEPVAAAIARWTVGDQWRAVLELLESWCHDLLLLGHGAPASALIHADRVEALRQWQERISPAQLGTLHRRILDTRDSLLLNVNKALAFDALWLALKRDVTQARVTPPRR